MNVNLEKYLKYKSKYLDLKNKYIGQSGGGGHIEESKLIKDVNNNIDKICDIYNDKNNINYQKLKEFIRKLLNSTNEILQIIESEKREIEERVRERVRESDKSERGRGERRERERESERKEREREENDKTFYIYTTGIANWGYNEVIDIWEQCRYKNIINQIKSYNFNHIIIEHCDPLIDAYGKNLSTDEVYNIKTKIKTIINKQDNTSQQIFKIKTEQTFKQEYLDFDSFQNIEKHYIILDFAHVIYYYYNDTNSKYFMNNHITKQNLVNNLNCIYINFPSQNKCDNYWEKINYFTYNKDSKKITSYIELFLKALSKNKNYLINTLKINSYIINNIINFYNVKNDLLKTIFYTKQIVIEIRRKLNIVQDEEVNKINQDNLYIEFFNKLFENNSNIFENNSNIFNINEYREYQKYLRIENIF